MRTQDHGMRRRQVLHTDGPCRQRKRQRGLHAVRPWPLQTHGPARQPQRPARILPRMSRRLLPRRPGSVLLHRLCCRQVQRRQCDRRRISRFGPRLLRLRGRLAHGRGPGERGDKLHRVCARQVASTCRHPSHVPRMQRRLPHRHGQHAGRQIVRRVLPRNLARSPVYGLGKLQCLRSWLTHGPGGQRGCEQLHGVRRGTVPVQRGHGNGAMHRVPARAVRGRSGSNAAEPVQALRKRQACSNRRFPAGWGGKQLRVLRTRPVPIRGRSDELSVVSAGSLRSPREREPRARVCVVPAMPRGPLARRGGTDHVLPARTVLYAWKLPGAIA